MKEDLDYLSKETSYSEGPTDPMSTKDWVLTFLVLMIPVVNIVFMIIWAVGGSDININKRNLFRAHFIMYGIMIAFILVINILMFAFS